MQSCDRRRSLFFSFLRESSFEQKKVNKKEEEESSREKRNENLLFVFPAVLGRVFQVLKIIYHLSIQNVATNIERDGLLLRFLLLLLISIVVSTTTTTSTTRRKRKVTEETTANFNDRSRKERATREAISPPSLRSRSRVFLHIRDA